MQDPGLAMLVANFLADDQSLPEVIDGLPELAEIPEGVAETVVREAFTPPVTALNFWDVYPFLGDSTERS